MTNSQQSRRASGQALTGKDPVPLFSSFSYPVFREWASQFPKDSIILDPFAGDNRLVMMLQAHGLATRFTSCDIAPTNPDVRKRDVFKTFPQGHEVCITNPPSLTKSSVKQSKAPAPNLQGYDNLWKLSLQLCLDHCSYVATIIPESFIASRLFKDRLYAVIALPPELFPESDQSSCLALWNPGATESYQIYSGEKLLGTNLELKAKIDLLLPRIKDPRRVTIKAPLGNIGVFMVDSTQKEPMGFVDANTVKLNSAQVRDRGFVRATVENDKTSEEIISRANKLLYSYRTITGDTFLATAKGLRDNGQFKRKLSLALVKKLIQEAAMK